MNQLLDACIQAEPVLADVERIINERVPGQPIRIAALAAVRNAIASAKNCQEPECPYHGQPRASSCDCSKAGEA